LSLFSVKWSSVILGADDKNRKNPHRASGGGGGGGRGRGEI
jgi:hypothetical protein